MRHFRADGRRFRDRETAGSGTQARTMMMVGVAGAIVITAAVFLFLLRTMDESGQDVAPVLFVALPLSVLSMAFAIFFINRQLGGGGIVIDTTTGEVSLRQKTGAGFGRVRLQQSEVREVRVSRQSGVYGRGATHPVRVLSQKGEHMVAFFGDPDTAREYAAELASLLSVSLRDDTGVGA
ncbi:MAG: hypothetical protein R6U36_08655 [Candidatus Fermentibacteraceae bacterium]